jgi:hypothetical protein
MTERHMLWFASYLITHCAAVTSAGVSHNLPPN